MHGNIQPLTSPTYTRELSRTTLHPFSGLPGPPGRSREGASLSASPRSTFSDILSRIEAQGESIDDVLQQATRGERLGPEELLDLQAKVHAFSQNMMVISSAVDRLISALKTTLNIQV